MSTEHLTTERLTKQYGSAYVRFREYSPDQLATQLRRHLYEELGQGHPSGIAVDFPISLAENAKREKDVPFICGMAESVGQVLGEIHDKPILDRRDIRALANIATILPHMVEAYTNGQVHTPADAVRDLALRLVQPDLNLSEVDLGSSENRTGKLMLYALSRVQPTESETSQGYLDLWTRLWENPRRSDLWTFSFVGLSRLNWDAALNRLGEVAQRMDRIDADNSWNPINALMAFYEVARRDGGYNYFKLKKWFLQRAADTNRSPGDPSTLSKQRLLKMLEVSKGHPNEFICMYLRQSVEMFSGLRPPVSWASTPEEIADHWKAVHDAVEADLAS